MLDRLGKHAPNSFEIWNNETSTPKLTVSTIYLNDFYLLDTYSNLYVPKPRIGTIDWGPTMGLIFSMSAKENFYKRFEKLLLTMPSMRGEIRYGN